MYELEGVLGIPGHQFVDRHVRSLLTWDIVVFFHRNPDAVLDIDGFASRLGRRAEELAAEVATLCGDKSCSTPAASSASSRQPTRDAIGQFVDACQDRGRRLALIALVLHKISPRELS